MSAAIAIREHGAPAVYKAACAALEGDYQPLAGLGVKAHTLGDAWRIQTQAYKSMTPGERAAEQMAVNSDLMRLKTHEA